MNSFEHRTSAEPNRSNWRNFAACASVDPEAFFPNKGGSTREAKDICAKCEVRDFCLEEALENDERFGVWGGLTEQERKKLKAGRFVLARY